MSAVEEMMTFISESGHAPDILKSAYFLSKSHHDFRRITKKRELKTSIDKIMDVLVKSDSPVLLDPFTLGLLKKSVINKIRKKGPITILCSDPEILMSALVKAKLDASDLLSIKDYDSFLRIAHASKIKARDELIASASVENDLLVVTNCANSRISLKFADTPFLSEIPEEDRGRFDLDRYGSTISWLNHKIEMSYDSLRYYIDEKYRSKVDKNNLVRHQNYGEALKKFRKESGLNQSDIEGLSERQVRRIEQGESPPTQKSLELLAKAHKLSLSKYLTEVSQRV